MKKIRYVLFILLGLLLLCLSGCGKYTSSYKAVGLIRSNTSQSALMHFFNLEGRMVFKLNIKNNTEGLISYSASLGEGRVTVSVDADGEKKEMFSISAGEELNASAGPFDKGTAYLILETDGKCENGKFEFEVK